MSEVCVRGEMQHQYQRCLLVANNTEWKMTENRESQNEYSRGVSIIFAAELTETQHVGTMRN